MSDLNITRAPEVEHFDVPTMINENYTEFDIWFDGVVEFFGPMFLMTSLIIVYLAVRFVLHLKNRLQKPRRD